MEELEAGVHVVIKMPMAYCIYTTWVQFQVPSLNSKFELQLAANTDPRKK